MQITIATGWDDNVAGCATASSYGYSHDIGYLPEGNQNGYWSRNDTIGRIIDWCSDIDEMYVSSFHLLTRCRLFRQSFWLRCIQASIQFIKTTLRTLIMFDVSLRNWHCLTRSNHCNLFSVENIAFIAVWMMQWRYHVDNNTQYFQTFLFCKSHFLFKQIMHSFLHAIGMHLVNKVFSYALRFSAT